MTDKTKTGLFVIMMGIIAFAICALLHATPSNSEFNSIIKGAFFASLFGGVTYLLLGIYLFLSGLKVSKDLKNPYNSEREAIARRSEFRVVH